MMTRPVQITARACLFVLLLAVAAVPCAQAQYFDNQSMQGDFAFSTSGTFSSAPPPFTGPVENIPFSEIGLFRFDGNGHVKAEYTIVVQGLSIGRATPYTAEGTYSVGPNGKMTIRTDDFVGGVRGNTIAYECVIVQRDKLAQCAFTELISYHQGPDPVTLPISAIVKLERQRYAFVP